MIKKSFSDIQIVINKHTDNELFEKKKYSLENKPNNAHTSRYIPLYLFLFGLNLCF